MSGKLKEDSEHLDPKFVGYSTYWRQWREVIRNRIPVLDWGRPTKRQEEALKKGENGNIPSGLSIAQYRASLPDDKPQDR
jgi:hypothetical protein